MLKFGDWGLGIGDCPIPNPQSPIPIIYLKEVTNNTIIQLIIFRIKYIKYYHYYLT